MAKQKKTEKENNKKINKEALFIENYLNNGFNGTKAYIDAGYQCTERSACVKAHNLLRKVNIRKAIKARINKLLDDKEELTIKWIQEVKKLAFSDLRDAVSWKNRVVTLKNSEDLDPNIASAISEVSEGRDGQLKIKLASKEKALELLGKYLSILTDKVEVIDTRKDLSKMTDKELQNEIDKLDNELNKINDKK